MEHRSYDPWCEMDRQWLGSGTFYHVCLKEESRPETLSDNFPLQILPDSLSSSSSLILFKILKLIREDRVISFADKYFPCYILTEKLIYSLWKVDGTTIHLVHDIYKYGSAHHTKLFNNIWKFNKPRIDHLINQCS